MEIFGGSYRRQYTSSQNVRNVIEGGRIADEIRKASNEHHSNTEIPNAEAFLDQELKEYQEKKSSKKEKDSFYFEKLSLWEQVKYYFANFWK